MTTLLKLDQESKVGEKREGVEEVDFNLWPTVADTRPSCATESDDPDPDPAARPPSVEEVVLRTTAEVFRRLGLNAAFLPEPRDVTLDVTPAVVGTDLEPACRRCLDYGYVCGEGSAAHCPHTDAEHDYCHCAVGLGERALKLLDERCIPCSDGQFTGHPCAVHAHPTRCRCVACATGEVRHG